MKSLLLASALLLTSSFAHAATDEGMIKGTAAVIYYTFYCSETDIPSKVQEMSRLVALKFPSEVKAEIKSYDRLLSSSGISLTVARELWCQVMKKSVRKTFAEWED